MSTKGDVTLTSADGKSVTLSGVDIAVSKPRKPARPVWSQARDGAASARLDLSGSNHYALSGLVVGVDHGLGDPVATGQVWHRSGGVWRLIEDWSCRRTGTTAMSSGMTVEDFMRSLGFRLHRWHHRRMPWRIAKKVLANPQRYPDHKVRAARERKKRRGRAWARGVIRSLSPVAGPSASVWAKWARAGLVRDP